MAVVTVHAAKTNLSQLLERAEAGEEIIIARGQVPVVKLVPIAPKPKRRPGLFPDVVVGPEFFEPLPEEELGLWEGRGDGARGDGAVGDRAGGDRAGGDDA